MQRKACSWCMSLVPTQWKRKLTTLLVLHANDGQVTDHVESCGLEKQTGIFSTCLGDMCESSDVGEILKIEIQSSGKGKKNRRNSHRVQLEKGEPRIAKDPDRRK